MWQDKTIGTILNNVAKEYNLDPADLSELYEMYFLYAKLMMQHSQLPAIDITGLFTFVPSPARIERLVAAGPVKGYMFPEIEEFEKVARRRRVEKSKKKRSKKLK